MKKEIEKVLKSLPHSSGIYQFFSNTWNIIYIGKSKNLKSRVNSYFSGQQKLNFAKKKMVDKVHDIKYIVTNNETESLLLENTLIKEHQPKYNILLKDDKNFLYIKITKEKYPKILKTRIYPESGKKDWIYYWPYTSGYYVWEIMKILKKVFWYWVAWEHFFRKSAGYNLDKYIFSGNLEASEEKIYQEYQEKISEIQKFLSWNTQEIKDRIHEEMLSHAEQLRFEEAAKRKVQLEALESLETMQIVRDGVSWNYFIVQILEKYESLYIWTIDIVEWKIISYQNYEVERNLEETSAEVLQSFIESKWSDFSESWEQKRTYIIPYEIDFPSSLGIHIEVPQIGTKHDLLKLCYKNLYEFAHKKHIASLSTKWFTKKTMQNLLDMLNYQAVNKDIIFECNDISHLSGNHTVASRSIIENGKKNPKKYKKFRIKTLDEGKIDDFWSMREVMTRRIAEIDKVWNTPDLIVIDGWKGQLWAVMEIVWKRDIQIVSIAKREEELFLPWDPTPIILAKDSAELRMIQAIRDEAHRFAISFNRDSRSKALKKNILESIPWIWPVTRKKILTKYWSVDALQEIEKKELIKVLWKSIVENLENHWII